jgi:peptidoglycan/xylan/chitin deacetylase (PgdA/CDA1 family)
MKQRLIAAILLCTLLFSSCAATGEPVKQALNSPLPPDREMIQHYMQMVARTLTDMEIGTAEVSIEYGNDMVLGIYYPVLQNAEIDAMIRQEIEEVAAEFKSRNQGSKPVGNKNLPVLGVDFATYLVQDRYVTVLFKVSDYSQDQSNPAVSGFTRHYDLTTSAQICPGDLLQRDWLRFLSFYCDRFFRSDAAYSAEIAPERYDVGVAPEESNYQNLIFTQDSVDILFEPGQVFDPARGILAVTIPGDKMAPYLTYVDPAAASFPEPDPSMPMVAVTFDDGPDKDTTPRLLDILWDNNARATFFVLGSRANANGNLIQRMVDEGHEIGNHSYNHPNLTKIGAKKIQEQLDLTDSAVFAQGGILPQLMRPTYGAVNDTVLATAGKPVILWSLDTLDWKTKSAAKTISAVMERVQDGDIILMHDIHKTTIDACEVLIPRLVQSGYQLVTVSEMMRAKGVEPVCGKRYSRIK